MSGLTREATTEPNRLLREAKTRYVSAVEIATIYAGMRDTDQAFDWLARAIDERAQAIGFLQLDPAFAGLRRCPRFVDLLKRLHPYR